MRILKPTLLADKNIILNNKGVTSFFKNDVEFKAVPYECMSAQTVKPSSVVDGADDVVYVIAADQGMLPAGQVFQIGSVEYVEGSNTLVDLVPVEFVRNKGV